MKERVAAIAAEHERLYGYTHRDRALEIVAVRVEVVGRSAYEPPEPAEMVPGTPQPERTLTTWFDAQPHATKVFTREQLRPGHAIAGLYINRPGTDYVGLLAGAEWGASIGNVGVDLTAHSDWFHADVAEYVDGFAQRLLACLFSCHNLNNR